VVVPIEVARALGAGPAVMFSAGNPGGCCGRGAEHFVPTWASVGLIVMPALGVKCWLRVGVPAGGRLPAGRLIRWVPARASGLLGWSG
jgi:hypothetical protein